MNIPLVKFDNGQEIPQVGLGTWQSKDLNQYNTAFEVAIEAGYRHLDTAQAYNNEEFLGAAWQESDLKREELFITTKIAVQNFGKHKAARSFAKSLERLQTDYVDLLLLHFPVTFLRKKTWQAVEEIQAAGQAKSIGVSNYTIRHLEEMKNYAKVLPAVNQVELHIFLQQPELIKYCQDNKIVVEAYAPLAHGKPMDDPVVIDIANKHNKTYAQIMLRWLIEQDLVVLVKSITPSRIRENIEIFNFQLDDKDHKVLAGLNRDLRTCWSPVHIP